MGVLAYPRRLTYCICLSDLSSCAQWGSYWQAGMMLRIQQTHDLPGKTVEHGYPAVQEVAVEVERHLVWSSYEIFDREKSRDWFHPPFIGESMVCSEYKGLNCTVLASCLNSGLIQDMSLDLVNVGKTWKATWCVFFGGGGGGTTAHCSITLHTYLHP